MTINIACIYALNKRDYAWIKTRIKFADSWVKDTLMLKHLVPACKALKEKFSTIR